MKAMTYRFRAIRCPAYNSLLGPGEGHALRQARDAKRGRDPRRELEAAGGRRGAGFAACPFLRGQDSAPDARRGGGGCGSIRLAGRKEVRDCPQLTAGLGPCRQLTE